MDDIDIEPADLAAEDWTDIERPEDTALVEVIQSAAQLLPSIQGQHSTELARVFSKLTRKQLRFITVYSECKSRAEACRRLGMSRTTYLEWGSVIEHAISVLERDPLLVATELLRVHTTEAVMVLAAGMKSSDESIRQNAARLMLEHAVGKPQTKHASTQDITIKLYGSIDTDRV